MSSNPQESWVALREDNRLAEVMFDRPDQNRVLGDIFLGRVDAVLPGIQAAFVDIGTGKAGFLHVSDLNLGDEGDGEDEANGSDNGDVEDGNAAADESSKGKGGGRGRGRGGGRGRGRGRRPRQLPPIQDHIKKGQTILVQVTKEAISTKGPRLTADISLPGRFLVYMPFASRVGVSRKIEGRNQRAKLRKMAQKILPRDSGGLIVRTVGEEVTAEKLEREFKRLHERWQKIRGDAEALTAPSPVHREATLISGVIRDLFSDKFEALRVDSKQAYDEIVDYVKSVDPDLLDRVHLHRGDSPLFDEYGVEEEIQKAFRRNVPLKSGGSLV
ncbi:MAG: ribonuclease E/G, partial [Longimicrobiales bacterium]